MKVVILAGGYGTRISEESITRPKPMVEIGGMPIIWHIMKNLYAQGINEFVIAAGYKQEYIKQWFYDRAVYSSDFTISTDPMGNTTMEYLTPYSPIETWKVTIVNTGLGTQTGGRLLRLKHLLQGEPFMVTYGDGIANIDLNSLLNTFYSSNTLGTITTYNYQQHKGVVSVENGRVESFREKSELDSQLINIGYMVFKPDILEWMRDDNYNLEKECLPSVSSMGQLSAYNHTGSWQCMDTLKEKLALEELWNSGGAFWKNWG